MIVVACGERAPGCALVLSKTLTRSPSCWLASHFLLSCAQTRTHTHPQLQVQKTGRVRPTKITKIFITHSHGDHSFGLPGMMCLIGQDRDRGGPPLEIYGPKGLRKWLRVAIRYSVSRIVPPYRVHELMDIPMAPEWRRSRNGKFHYRRQRQGESRYWTRPQQDEHGDLTADNDPESWMYLSGTINMEASRNFGEIDGGRCVSRVNVSSLSAL